MPRTLHRLLAGSAAALAAVAGTALPASAAPGGDPSIGLIFPDTTIAVDGAGKTTSVMAWLDVPAGKDGVPTPVRSIRLTVDTADVAGIATVVQDKDEELSPGESCTTAGTVLTCTLTGPFGFDHAGLELLPLAALRLTAKPGVTVGAAGKIALTAQADNGPVATSTAAVRIGEGVDLAAVEAKTQTVAPGARAAADLRVANAGERAVNGSVLVLVGWSDELLDGPGFTNCTYGILLVCTFTDVLAPGKTYALSNPITVKAPGDAAIGSSAYAFGTWFTPADWKEALAALPSGGGRDLLGKPGTGSATRLQGLTSAAGVPQTDSEPTNNSVVSGFVVGGSRRPDMAAVGATVRGSVGDRVKARVGVANNGPGTLYQWHFDNIDLMTRVVVPAGLRAVEVDDDCYPGLPGDDEGDWSGDDEPVGVSQYVCFPYADRVKAGGRELFDFTFQIDDQAGDAVGSVAINEDDLPPGERIDRDARNDAAKILVDATGGTGGGGGLPVTGADTALVAGTGALLLLAGGAGVLLVRRRRLRFTV